MAFEQGPQMIIALPAGGDLSTHQYKFVEFTAGQVTLCNAATDIPVGVLQNKPDAAGKPAEILVFGVSKITSDAALAQGDLIGTSANGRADAKVPGTDITEYAVGRMLAATSAANAVGTAMINCLNPHRAS